MSIYADSGLPEWPKVLYAPIPLGEGSSVDLPVAVEYEDGRVHLLDDLDRNDRVRPQPEWARWPDVVPVVSRFELVKP